MKIKRILMIALTSGALMAGAGLASAQKSDIPPDLAKQAKVALETARTTHPESGDLARLLHEVDSALDRMEAGTYGICESCHDPIERDRLMVEMDALFPAPQFAAVEQTNIRHFQPPCVHWSLAFMRR